MDQENYSPESDDEYLPIQQLKKSKRRRYQKYKQKKCKSMLIIAHHTQSKQMQIYYIKKLLQ